MIILLFIILICLVFILSVGALLSLPFKKRRKIILIGLRLLFLIILVVAFFQPSFTITQLDESNKILPILIDVSESMDHFNSDSLYKSMVSRIDALRENTNEDTYEPAYFLFGDSLRKRLNHLPMHFKDQSSVLPSFESHLTLLSSKKLVLLSDGNWINSQSAYDQFLNRECYYLPLTKKDTKGFLHVTAPSEQQSILGKEKPALSCAIQGFTTQSDSVVLTIRNSQTGSFSKSIQIDRGYFNRETSIPLTFSLPGKRLYEVTASLKEDSLTSTCYSYYSRLPSVRRALIYSDHYSLDRRFLQLALKRDSNWHYAFAKKSIDTSVKSDILIFFTWDNYAQRLLNSYPNSGVLFFGCIPSDKSFSVSLSQYSLKASPEIRYSLAYNQLIELPPLTHIISSKQFPLKSRKDLLFIDTSDNNGKNMLPLLTEGYVAKRFALALAARGIWRWDFNASEASGQESAPYFSDLLISKMVTNIERNQNNHFSAIPIHSPITTIDSIRLQMSIPPLFQNEVTTAISLTVINHGGDSIEQSTIEGPFSHTYLYNIQPCEVGTYHYRAILSNRHSSKEWSDTLRIVKDNSELRIHTQNVLSLKEIALPINVFDSVALLEVLQLGPDDHKAETVTSQIQLQRSWLMLWILLCMLSIEWLLRKIWRFD